MSSNAYFAHAADLDLTADQSEVIEGIRRCLMATRPAKLAAADTRASLTTDGTLELAMIHADERDIAVDVTIDRYGEVIVSSEALHPTFGLRFNLRWEPEESLGDLDDAVNVICAAIVGRLQSEVVWGGHRIARSRDILVGADGERRVLHTQYHADGLLGSIVDRRRELRRIGFV